MFLTQAVSAQVLPRSGTHFTFGIPEGSDNLAGPINGLGTSVLSVNIVSEHDGRGIATSPSGFCQEFTFAANTVTTVFLPYNLMHLNDIGITNKGVLIRTSQPANVTFHDFLAEAGEATQIYPDEALDTNYRITTWGIFDDPGEDNHSQFIITATRDSTDVTITPSVNTLGNNPANVSISVRLNRGECYMVKADITDLPSATSLSNSTVISSKPVSVISAVSCGYNPLGTESCQELLDEILPRKITGTTFYAAPLFEPDATNTILLTSDTKNFFVITTGGTTYASTNGSLQLDLTAPDVFTVTAPAQCFLLTEGFDIQAQGDPTFVTVLPQDQYADTLLWFTPDFSDTILFQTSPFANYVSVIYPQASESQILLDGLPITSFAAPQTIFSTPMSGIIVPITTGEHEITSPVPVFAIAAGFADADGYSFIPGTIAPELKIDTIPAFLSISATDAKICRTFDVTVNSIFRAADAISSAELTITYDPKILTLLSFNLGHAAQGGQWQTDTRIPGVIKISASCLAPYSDSDAIATMTFSTGPTITTTTIGASIDEMGGESKYTALGAAVQKDISLQEIRDTINAVFSLDPGHAVLGSFDTASISLVNAPNQPVKELDIFVKYDHNIDSLLLADLRNTIIPAAAGLTTFTPIPVDQFTDEIRVTFTNPITLNISGIIARLLFQTYVTDSISGKIDVSVSMTSTRPCPLDILSNSISGVFTGSDTCGTSVLRSQMQNKPFSINSIVPNPSTGSFTVDLDRRVFGGEPVHLALFDMLGNEVWNTDYTSTTINQKIVCTTGYSVPAGSYFLRASITGHTETQKILIAR
jgi:hypothetical protein